MRRNAPGRALPGPEPTQRHDWHTIKTLLPYLWAYKWRVLFALTCLIAAKFANIGVPIVFKHLIDSLAPPPAGGGTLALVPLGLLAAYGVLRFSTSMFTELRELVFARVTQRAVRTISLQVFHHLHALSLRFHLERQTGGLTRDIERGTRSIGSLISYTLYSILPTLVEIALVLGLLATQYEASFALITLVTLVIYISFTVAVTNWRTALRRHAKELDSAANSRAIDSLINYETVKYFNNEDFEARRYDEQLGKWEQAQVKSQTSLALLNLGQAVVVATGVTAMMWRATVGVTNGSMSLGDIVLVNALMIQLYIPLNFLGVLYREIRQSLTDIERMFGLLHTHREIRDAPGRRAATQGGLRSVRARDFGYDASADQFDVNLTSPRPHGGGRWDHSGSGQEHARRDCCTVLRRAGGRRRIRVAAMHPHPHAVTACAAHRIVPQDTVCSTTHPLQHPLWPARRQRRGRGGRSSRGATARLHPAPAGRLRDPRGRTGPEALRRREAAGGDRPRAAQESAHPDFRRGHQRWTREREAIRRRWNGGGVAHPLVIGHRPSTVCNATRLVLEAAACWKRGSHTKCLARAGAYAQMGALQQQEEQLEAADTAAATALAATSAR